MNIILSVDKLKKSYGNTEILKGISFEVYEGEIFGLLGANGAGKSTTLECIEGIKSYKSGVIKLFGQDISRSRNFLKSLGVQLQSTSLQERITVLEAMKFYCKWQNIAVRFDLLEKFGLKTMYDKQYCSLSIGQKRRLHLALAISNDPKLVILDEPTAGLDVQGRVELHAEIRLLKESGVTIILASHDMAEVEMLCDRIAILVKGEIKFVGTEDEIVSQANNDKIIKIKTTQNKLLSHHHFKYCKVDKIEMDYITLLSSDITKSLSEILEKIQSLNVEILDLKIDGLSLEEKFMEVVNIESSVS